MALDIDRVPTAGTWWRQVASGLDPLRLREPRTDGRWQRGEVTGAVYLAADRETVWAEWYRALAERALPPRVWLPCELWRLTVELEQVADLSDERRLRRLGLEMPLRDRRTWPVYQEVGETVFAEGYAGLIAPSAARPEGLVLCVFERDEGLPGLTADEGPEVVADPPTPPRSPRT